MLNPENAIADGFALLAEMSKNEIPVNQQSLILCAALATLRKIEIDMGGSDELPQIIRTIKSLGEAMSIKEAIDETD